jgi:hypothetical protein
MANHPESRPFWDAAAEGRFVVPRCASCGRYHWYPRALCPFCFSDRVEWRPASGRGRVYSYTVMRRASAPYVLAYVTLEEGPTMLTNIVDGDVDAVRVGQDVRLVFKGGAGELPLPMFTAAAVAP